MKNYKFLISAVSLLVGVSGFHVQAEGGVTGNIGVTNNYIWRGVTQTDKKPAVSGGLDYSHGSGFYAGTWASNVDFGDDTSTEVDLYAGFSNSVGDFSYDVGYIFYGYPDGTDVDFSEVMASASWKMISIGISTTAHSDWESDFGDDTYFELNLAFEVFKDVELGVHLGSYDYQNGNDYQDYNINLSKAGFSFMISRVSEDAIDDDYSVAISYTHEINF